MGGGSTHAVITGHTGLPSSKLFTGIDQLKEGDTFKLYILDAVLTYKVDQIRVILPYEIESLAIEKDKDYATLVTCTPYGINTHRLLVRGERVENPPEKETSNERFTRVVSAQEEKSWFSAFYAITRDKTMRYHIFSQYIATISTADAYRVSFSGPEDISAFISRIQGFSAKTSDWRPKPDDKIITLSTCIVGDYGKRRVLHASLEEVTLNNPAAPVVTYQIKYEARK